MPYQIRLSHIHPDYSVEPPPKDSWSAVVEEDEALLVMMNRVAIVRSQNPSHEYPVMDVVTGGLRATITVIGGQLYYTDPNMPNRSNIKVVPDGALKLLHGSSLESVQQDEAAALEAAALLSPSAYRRSRIGPRLRGALLVLLLATFVSMMTITWKELSDRPRLVPAYEFVPGAIDGIGVRAYAGVYVEGIQEGGQVFELTNDGQFNLYRMWRTAEPGGFSLRQVESLPIRLGAHGERPALMAGDFFLLLPRRDGRILMSGVLFYRHLGVLKDLGVPQDTL